MSEEEISQSREHLYLDQLLVVLKALKSGDFSLRMPTDFSGVANDVA